MRLLLAIFLPPIVFFTINRPVQGLFCALLLLTVIGWPVAAIWAVYALSQYRNEEMRRDMGYGYRSEYRDDYRRDYGRSRY